MALVMNWKSPKGIVEPEQVQNHLRELGLSITVVQSHRVPSGKLNTTFEGTDSEISEIWKYIKNLEKKELLEKFKNSVRSPRF